MPSKTVEGFMRYRPMTEQQYRTAKGVNKSTLWELRRSPAHYKYALENQSKDTPALQFGRALHMAVLQPFDFEMSYAIAPDVDRRTKEGRDIYNRFVAESNGLEIITEEDFDAIREMRDAVFTDPDAAALLKNTQREVPVFWTDPMSRIRCKCRLDAVKEGWVIDVKTCLDASTNHFMKDALKYGYDVQAAHYIRAYRSQHDDNPKFAFICIEKNPPYAVNTIIAGDAFIDRGTLQLIDLLDKLSDCRKHRKWGGYGMNELILPEWASIPYDD